MEKPIFSGILNDAVVRRMAGPLAYARGADFAAFGHVESLTERGDTLKAVIRGPQRQSVVLTAADGLLDYECDCEAGASGTFCMHCAATALAWLAAGAKKVPKRGAPKPLTLADAAKVLQDEEKDAIVQLVLEWANEDVRVRDKLILFASSRTGPQATAAVLAGAFKKAVAVRGRVPRKAAISWAQGANLVVNQIEKMLLDGSPAAVIGVCESALADLSDYGTFIDDTEGLIDGLRERLEDFHYRACLEAPPDPAALGARFLRFELSCRFGVFANSLSKYADLLGSDGLKAYDDAAFAEVGNAMQATYKPGSWGRYRLFAILEKLVQKTGDVDRYIGVLSSHIGDVDTCRRIFDLLRAAKRYPEVLEWAERAYQLFSGQNAWLRGVLREEYERAGRHADAVALTWPTFAGNPTFDQYRTFEARAQAAGTWPEWRPQVLEVVLESLKRTRERFEGRPWSESMMGDQSDQIAILLYEGEWDEARREADVCGYMEKLWHPMADMRVQEHPADAAPVYLRLAEDYVRANRFRHAMSFLAKARRAMRRLGQLEEFSKRVAVLRQANGAKRDFAIFLDDFMDELFDDPPE